MSKLLEIFSFTDFCWASSIDSEAYLLSCYHYIELNPVRANMVKAPDDYPWSSHAANGLGAINSLITPHSLYMSLASDTKQRLIAYREGFKKVMGKELIDKIRASVQTGTPLGNEKFKDEIKQLLGVNVGQDRRGRPVKHKTNRALTPFRFLFI